MRFFIVTLEMDQRHFQEFFFFLGIYAVDTRGGKWGGGVIDFVSFFSFTSVKKENAKVCRQCVTLNLEITALELG